MDDKINDIVTALLLCGPQAIAESKHLISAVANQRIDDIIVADTTQRIARVRASAEGKEGVSAFLGKRKANWVIEG
jgi:methylglutaconyl-CoA hydratase